jgi:DNA repair protein RadC
MADGDPPSDNHGHRARLRDRLLGRGGETLLDHELIEYLLTLATPRKDTKPVAKALLREFGGIGGVFTADREALLRVEGMGEVGVSALKIVQATALRLLQAEVAARPVLGNWQALLDYLRADMAHHAIERVRVLHLNTRKTRVALSIV